MIYLGQCFDCDSEELAIVNSNDRPELIEKHLAKLHANTEEYNREHPEHPPFTGPTYTADDVDQVVYCTQCGTVKDVIEHYKDEYRIANQPRIEGVIVNPNNRYYFDLLDNNLRPTEEVMEWQHIPYIVGEGEGNNYDVRCFDGGAWDRSTGKAWNLTLEEAIKFVKANWEEY